MVLDHILVPLDGSNLAECVLPHVMAIAPVLGAAVTMIRVVDTIETRGPFKVVNPLEWHITKQEAIRYLEKLTEELTSGGIEAKGELLEGSPAECIVEYARANHIPMIALSSHGRSGLSGWNVSSVVQKIILRSNCSSLIVRAYHAPQERRKALSYRKLFLPLDISPRSEFVIPLATSLARHYDAKLYISTIIGKPEMFRRMPLSDDDNRLSDQLIEHNYQAVLKYYSQLESEIKVQGVDVHTGIKISDSPLSTLHELVDEQKADLVIITAHGSTGITRWPYGSVATSLIAYGTTPLIILQDLPSDQIQTSLAEVTTYESKGH